MQKIILKERHSIHKKSEFGLFGPIFFKKSVTAAKYQNMPQEFIAQLALEESQNGYFH